MGSLLLAALLVRTSKVKTSTLIRARAQDRTRAWDGEHTQGKDRANVCESKREDERARERTREHAQAQVRETEV